MPLVYVDSRAVYQGDLGDNSGIEIYIFDDQRSALLSVARTDVAGRYSLAVPSDAPYWLVADAPLYRRLVMSIEAANPIPEIVLAGGDINHDACIGPADLDLLTLNYGLPDTPQTDINRDGITDIADLAILTGNYDPSCEIPPVTPTDITVTPSPSMTPTTLETMPETTPVIEPTGEITSELTPEVEPTQELDPSATPTPTETLTPTVEPSLLELTPELTAEVPAN
jgi:hypothetical protein